VKIQVVFFCVVTLCSDVGGYQPFREDGGSKVLRNVGILPQHYTVSQRSEDGGSKVLRNVGILPQHYMASQPRTPRL
jgi:hypothetical protein